MVKNKLSAFFTLLGMSERKEISAETKAQMRDLRLEKLRLLAAEDITKANSLTVNNPESAQYEFRKAVVFKWSLLILAKRYNHLPEEFRDKFLDKHQLLKFAVTHYGVDRINRLNGRELDEILAIHMKNIWELRAAGKSKIKATTQE